MILWTAPRWSPTCRLKCRLIAEPGHDRAAWVEMVGYRWELVAERPALHRGQSPPVTTQQMVQPLGPAP